MKPTQEQIDRRVVEARMQSSSSVLVAIADKVAELERAAETSRAEHAAALGLATARIRELEGEREDLLALLGASEFEEKCGRIMWGPAGETCSDEMPCAEHRRRARIEKAAKGTT